MARFARLHFERERQIGRRQQRGGFFRPLGQLQAAGGKQIAKAGIFPFTGIVETVEIKVPD